MSLVSYIDLDNFEITDEPSGYIACDYEIAKTIALLNKKGYKTSYSCAGHNKNGFLQRTQKEPIEIYNEWLKKNGDDKTVHVIGFDEKYFYHKDDETATYPYIVFKEIYNFDVLPERFKMNIFNDCTEITKCIEFFIDEKAGIRRKDSDIDKELEKTYKDLYKWALSLDNNE